MAASFYDSFGASYDRFVNWDERLAHEIPFIATQLAAHGASTVLDAACGTGMHAVALAKLGFKMIGADMSAGMVNQAHSNARAAELDIPFFEARFGQLADQMDREVDALLCLGNSLPHLLTDEQLQTALADFAAVLRPGGLVLIQNRNFDAVVADQARWMPPQGYRQDDSEWLFIRFYDWRPDGILDFNLVTLTRQGAETWQQRVKSTQLRPLSASTLTAALAAEDFDEITCFGSMEGAPFDPVESGNLIVSAIR